MKSNILSDLAFIGLGLAVLILTPIFALVAAFVLTVVALTAALVVGWCTLCLVIDVIFGILLAIFKVPGYLFKKKDQLILEDASKDPWQEAGTETENTRKVELPLSEEVSNESSMKVEIS